MSGIRAAIVAIALMVSPAAARGAAAPNPADAFPRSERAGVAEIQRLTALGRFAEADSLAHELVERAEARKGSGARMLPDALDLRADVLFRWARPNDPDLLAAAVRAVEAREGTGADAARLAAGLQRLGVVRLRRVEYAAADSFFTRALATLEAMPRADAAAIAVARGWHAEGLRVTKKLPAAEEMAKRAIAELGSPVPADTAALVRAHMTLGNTRAERGDPEGAIAALDQALAVESMRPAPDSLLLATIHRNVGRAATIGGERDRAIDAYQRAAGIQERRLGPEHPELATSLYMLTFAYSHGGDFVAMRGAAERARAIREKVYGPVHPQVAIAMWQIAGAERELGDAEASVRTLERSVAILREAPSALPSDLATALSNLGSSRLAAGDGTGAREAMSEAIAIREQVFGPGSGRGLWAMTRLGQALLLEGRTREAEALFDTVAVGSGRRNPFDVADAWEYWGTAAWANGSRERALERWEWALAFHDSALGSGSPRTQSSLELRAAARWALGRRAEALADARRCDRASLEFLRSAARGLSEHEALGFERGRSAGRDILLALATDSVGLGPEDRAAVFDAVVRSRLAVLDELSDESRAVPRDDPELAPLVQELESARSALAAAMVSALRESRPPDSTATEARERREAAERALAERSGSFRAVTRRAAAGAADVSAALPEGSVLVSYVRYRSPRHVLANGAASGVNPHADAAYAALLLRSGQPAPDVVPLGRAAELEPMLARWAEALATPPPAAPAAARAAQRRCDAIGRAVRSRLWDPVARLVKGADRIHVVPDGALHGVNFLALPDAAGRYLAESGPVIHRLAAERDLLPWPEAAGGEGLLVMGGADFDNAASPSPVLAAAAPPSTDAGIHVRSSIPDSLRVRFAPLPQTAAEANEVARLWRDAGVGQPLELTGTAASEAAFKRLAPGHRVVHVATHGFALGATPPGSAREGARGIGAVGSGERAARGRTAPLLAGIALAGSNSPAAPDGEDGFLTAEEITALDLSGTEWAVLSACETGLSDPDAVEAVQGLHRSFRRAGARTVIMSLWAVDDASTRAWMTRLYGARLQRRMDTAAAVRESSRALVAERRAAKLDTHPFRWAAFVASGDWR